jgi:predicted ribosome quality control (RQC) complex YloA/Tae2 family protein
VASLSKLVNLSPQILDELVLRSKVDREKDISVLSTLEKEEILIQLHSLLDFFAPTIYFEEKDGKKEMAAFSTILLEKFSGLEKKNFESLSEALDEFYSAGGHQAASKSKKFEEVKKLEFQLSGQEKAETGFLQVEKDSREKGQKILEKFEEVEKLLSAVKRLKKEGKTKDEIKAVLKLDSIANEEIEAEI